MLELQDHKDIFWHNLPWGKMKVGMKLYFSMLELGLCHDHLDWWKSIKEIEGLAKENGVKVVWERRYILGHNDKEVDTVIFTIKSRRYPLEEWTPEEMQKFGIEKPNFPPNLGMTKKIRALKPGDSIEMRPGQRNAVYTIAKRLGYDVTCNTFFKDNSGYRQGIKVTRKA